MVTLMNKGFTLIEIIISLIILSVILLISSNLLSSALNYQSTTNLKLKKVNELNLASTIIRRDLRQAVNVPSRDFFGNLEPGTFNGDYSNKSISFNTYISDISIDTSSIKKILYFFTIIIFTEDNIIHQAHSKMMIILNRFFLRIYLRLILHICMRGDGTTLGLLVI